MMTFSALQSCSIRPTTVPSSRSPLRTTWSFLLIILSLLLAPPSFAQVESAIEIPLLAAFHGNDRGVLEMVLIHWDKKPSPDPIALRWIARDVVYGPTHLQAMEEAFRYAIRRTSAPARGAHTGTVSVRGDSYLPTTSDGPSAGAVMAVGFLALLRGDPIQRGIALTGTIDPDGHIGPVGTIPDKIRAAAREGFRTILIPGGQYYDPHWNLDHLSVELGVTIREVGTIEEAYHLMTGRRLSQPDLSEGAWLEARLATLSTRHAPQRAQRRLRPNRIEQMISGKTREKTTVLMPMGGAGPLIGPRVV
jgi:hypothetical protein